MSMGIAEAAATLPVFALGAIGSLIAGIFTAVGALPALLGNRIGLRTQNTLLGFATGVMPAATVFSLIIPGIDHSERIYGSAFAAVLLVSFGILAGGALIALINRYAPHEHFISGREGADWLQLRRLWLFVISNEIIPETNCKGYASLATGGLMIGFVVMMQLDVLFS